MARPLAPATILSLLVGVALAGCLVEDRLVPFSETAAPQWAPGFSWNWTVIEEDAARGVDDGVPFDHARRSVTAHSERVLGTAAYEPGEVGYVVAATGGFDSYSRSGHAEFRLVDAGTHESVGAAHDWSDCGDPMRLDWYRTEREDSPDALRFPLVHGATWSGSDGWVSWDSKVEGEERVKVPAGAFDAIRIRTTVAFEEDRPRVMGWEEDGPFVPDAEEERMEAVETVWYAPAVRHIVRSEATSTFTRSDGDGEYTNVFSQLLELASYSLDEEEGIDFGDLGGGWLSPRISARPPDVRLASSVPFPVNAAETNTTVTFSLVPGSEGGDDPFVHVTEPGEFVVPPGFEGLEVQWRIMGGPDGSFWAAGTGDSFTVTLPPGGLFEVLAELGSAPAPRPHRVGYNEDIAIAVLAPRPVAEPWDGCDLGRTHARYWLGSATAEVSWEKAYDLDVAAGLPRAVPLGEFPVLSDQAAVFASWTQESDVPVVTDRVTVSLTPPSGAVEAVSANGDFRQGEPGDWTAVWDVHGTMASGVSPAVVVGHSAVVTLAVRY